MLNFNFANVLRDNLDPDSVFRISSSARPTGDYLFATLLPEMNKPTYEVRSGNMTVRATMAGAVGKDSPYPPTGVVEASSFLQNAVKLATTSKLTEDNLIELQALLMNLQVNGGDSTTGVLQQEALNFLNKVIIQSHMDRAEWMRAKALVTGALNWTFNGLNVSVSYGVPTANILTNRTGTAAWDSTASGFWADIGSLYRQLRYRVRAFIVHPDTLLKITGNSVNSLEIVQQQQFAAGGSTTTLRRLMGANERPSDDFRNQVTLISYGDEAEIIDPSNPGRTTAVPFMPVGKILAVGIPTQRGYVVGQGSTEDPNRQLALGYTHIGPTVESGGRPGRWARLYTPDHLPMQLHGQGVSWVMPVIENPNLIAVASSDLS